MVVFGGYTTIWPGPVYFNDVWVLSLSGNTAWKSFPIDDGPSPRIRHTAIYDPVLDRMVVFGGSDQLWDYKNDVWAMTLSGSPVWNQLIPSATPPSARNGHSAIYDDATTAWWCSGGMTTPLCTTTCGS